MIASIARFLLVVLLILLVPACAHYPVNAPLPSFQPTAGYRFANFPPSDENDDELFIIVSFSGGGSRAAAFTFGLLEALRDTPITYRGKTRSLLSQVDVISSVSGSSFTAAYYALHGDAAFDSFPGQFLYRDLQGEVIASAVNPLNWPRLASPTFDRIDLASELYDRKVFEGRTYGDLLKSPRRPYVLLHATDVTLGRRFEFSQEQFDFLYSDLASVPLSRAVAASAAFPVVFNPIAFENLPAKPDFQEPAWVDRTLSDPDAEPRVRRRAADLRSYADKTNRAHIRLLDGAIADYIGLRAPMHAFLAPDGDLPLRTMLHTAKIKNLVIISANAVRTPPIVWDSQIQSPGWFDMLYLTASAPIRNYAYDTQNLFHDMLKADAAVSGKYQPHFITVDFEHVPDGALRQRLENTRTSFSLTRQEADDLRRGARQALQASPDVPRLIQALSSTAP